MSETIIIAGAVIGALLTIAKGAQVGVRKMRRGYAWGKNLGQRLEAMADIAEAQLKPNGGSSLLDKVSRIDSNHAEAERHWQSLEAGLDKLGKRFDRVETFVATPAEVEDE